MADNDAGVSRRGFLRTTAGATAATVGASGTALAQDGNYGGYLSNVGNYDGSTVDYTGQDEVTVQVGVPQGGLPFGFGPPAINVAPGTTVTWEWTGEGGAHNVVHEEEAFNSGDTQETGTFEYTFEEAGVFQYFCRPHKGAGMKGVVAVGDTAEGELVSPEDVSVATATEGGEEEDGGGGGGGGAGEPDFGGYLSDANLFDGVVDMRGQDEVTVNVGAGSGFAFDPAAVHVDNGTTVVWEWTGEGGAHNVVSRDEVFDSGSPQGSGSFEFTFEEDGVFNYFCSPHEGQGMKGSIVVGTDFPTVAGGEDVGPGDLPDAAKALGVGTMFVTVATLGLAYFFMKYGGDYGDYEG